MSANHKLYVAFSGFSSDLLFWIVISSLFLTTVKNFTAFDIMLVETVGMASSLIFYPITNLIIKKFKNKASIIIGSVCLLLSIVLFTIGNHIVWFMIGQFFYHTSSVFLTIKNVMLKNNLKAENREGEYIKYRSYSKLFYAILTTFIAFLAAYFFNINPYLPMICAIICAAISLVLACFYKENYVETPTTQNKVSFSEIVRYKHIILIILMSVFCTGVFKFMHSNSNLLMQITLQNYGIALYKISFIISFAVLISRIIRVLANVVFPKIYNKVKVKSKILIFLCFLLLVAGISYSLGSNFKISVWLSVILIIIGLFTVITFRDCYGTLEEKIILNNTPPEQTKYAMSFAQVIYKVGNLIINGFSLIVLKFAGINIMYVCLIPLLIVQFCISIPLSKYLNKKI